MKLDHLEILEVEMSHWELQPIHVIPQRILATELRTYCPSLRIVVFRIGHHRAAWVINAREEWTHEDGAPRSTRDDTLWRTV